MSSICDTCGSIKTCIFQAGVDREKCFLYTEKEPEINTMTIVDLVRLAASLDMNLNISLVPLREGELDDTNN